MADLSLSLSLSLSLCAEFRLAVVQLQVSSVKADNLSKARRLIQEAAAQGSKLVVLPVRLLVLHCGPTLESDPSIHN